MSQSAFPQPEVVDSDGILRRDAEPGLSFRQYAATRAMQGMCSGETWPIGRAMKEIADRAWIMADALLAAEHPRDTHEPFR